MIWLVYAAIFLCLLIAAAYVTNPFNRFTYVRRTYRAEIKRNVLEAIDNNQKLRIQQGVEWQLFAILKNGIHILSSRWHKSPASKSTTVPEIIEDIYDLRFDPTKLLLTSGDHFSALFVRNLGVFYYPTLDTHIPTSQIRWHDRQIVYLQTLAYALGVFAKHDRLTTTIVPTGRYEATCVNFYAYPSDTMYGMLYALSSLLGIDTARPYQYGNPRISLDTIPAAKKLLETYSESLSHHYEQYRAHIYDETTGLIKKDVRLSGAKDITKRSCAFFDNVVFWKTTKLAGDLGLIDKDEKFLNDLKKRIIANFWLENEGYFLEDLSDEGVKEKYYSSDWLIVLATGFLKPEKASERKYFIKSVHHVKKHKIDMPFAIKYQNERRAHRQFAAVRLAVASYGGDSIWSFWGMEYIKVLLALYTTTSDTTYLKHADYHIDMYKKKIVEYSGYPEVYDADGKMLETPLYRSVRQTGWVIGFEQVLAIRESL